MPKGALPPFDGVVAVHAGAGWFDVHAHADLKQVMREACRAGAAQLADGQGALEAAVAAVQLMEHSGVVNAGSGAVLNRVGEAELDAGVFCCAEASTDTGFGAVGAAPPSICSPVCVARELLKERSKSKRRPHPLGLVSPSLLCGPAVAHYAAQRGLCVAGCSGDKDGTASAHAPSTTTLSAAQPTTTATGLQLPQDPSHAHVCPLSVSSTPHKRQRSIVHTTLRTKIAADWTRYSSALQELEQTETEAQVQKRARTHTRNLEQEQCSSGASGSKRRKAPSSSCGVDMSVQQHGTVGAVVVDAQGHCAVPGAGTYATRTQTQCSGSVMSTYAACATSGRGEDHIEHMTARTVCDHLCGRAVERAQEQEQEIKEEEERSKEHPPLPAASGFVCLVVTDADNYTSTPHQERGESVESVPVDIVWGHTAPHFAAAFLSGDGQSTSTVSQHRHHTYNNNTQAASGQASVRVSVRRCRMKQHSTLTTSTDAAEDPITVLNSRLDTAEGNAGGAELTNWVAAAPHLIKGNWHTFIGSVIQRSPVAVSDCNEAYWAVNPALALGYSSGRLHVQTGTGSVYVNGDQLNMDGDSQTAALKPALGQH